MRFKLNLIFDFNPFGNTLPANYQYELSGWIYHTLAHGDTAYSEWLHQNGYIKDQKQFKLFTFSNLQIPKLQMDGDRLILLSDQAQLYLSFLPERATEEFIKGLFSSQSFVLGDRHSQVQCHVQSIELIEPPTFEPSMTFRTLSPMVLSGHLPNGKPTYLSPDAPDTARMIYENLCAKYQAFYGKPFEITPENNTDPQSLYNGSISKDATVYTSIDKQTDRTSEPDNENQAIPGTSFEILSPPKRKKITIKAGTPQQTYIIGYQTHFRISLPAELMRIMNETGIGKAGSMGFGMVEEYKQVTSPKKSER
ncbi:MAG: CRISPR-associated endoribonuclease Cas6 [Bacteroidota bacterium]|nr:CRISPR-associated endoribonuclease Cas6 [Bacteroidota bacterium]